MSPLTHAQLARICMAAPIDIVQRYVEPLNSTLIEFDIDTAWRAAMFLTQCAHESLQFLRVREMWGPTPEQLRYEGRADLGNNQPGDGSRFRGRGLIQITGRANYAACSQALYGDSRLTATPELLEEPPASCRSAGWFWQARTLNQYADAGDLQRCTRKINGGLNGLPERMLIYSRAKGALGI